MIVLAGLVLAVLPLLSVVVLLAIATRRERRVAEAAARQIAVTDAIHRELGAIVAPTVEPRAWGPWRLTIPVPFERPDVVASVLGITHRTVTNTKDSPPMEIVLTPQEEYRACA
ncbi:MAG: hypothetical protein HYR51_06275 [Candidatus Rokubacteria bacterium]|nr:hypothetical protein [Candidatus Rokubacteria bacterium]